VPSPTPAAANTAAAHELGHHAAALELLARRLIQIARELRERRQLPVFASARRTPAAGVAAFHDLGLRIAADPRHRDAALIAGLMPALNKSVSRKICPSVIEMTFVGTKAVTSPAWVSITRKRRQRPGLAFDRGPW